MAAKKRGRTRWDEEYGDYYDERPIRRSSGRVDGGPPSRQKPLKHIAVLGLAGLLFLTTIWLVAGQSMLEKTIQSVLAPCGLVWLGLLLTVYFSFLRRQGLIALMALASWLVITLAGNSIMANWLARSVESRYFDFDYDNLQTIDVVVLLGGGTSTTPSGRPQATATGDRVIVAARLFRDGKIKRIICSGTSGLPQVVGELTAADSAAQLLVQLGVDPQKILKIGGRNTLEEVQAFDRWLNQQPDRDLQVGLLTSAWHLNRALRLSQSVGIDAIGIPANFVSQEFRQEPALLIPSATNVLTTTQVLKEWLAGAFGR